MNVDDELNTIIKDLWKHRAPYLRIDRVREEIKALLLKPAVSLYDHKPVIVYAPYVLESGEVDEPELDETQLSALVDGAEWREYYLMPKESE